MNTNKSMGKSSDEGVMLNHQLRTVSHRGVSTKGRTLVIKSYFCVKVTVRCINFNIARLSNYQDELHDKIKELHDGGLGYRRIACWLNENQYKTPRGNIFKNNHVHSIAKKRKRGLEIIDIAPKISVSNIFFYNTKFIAKRH